MKKVRLIYNAKSGQNKFKPYVEDVIGKFCDNGFEVTTFRINKGVDVDEFVKATPKDTYVIIIAAGDGTLNKVVNVMMKNNIDVPIAVIPAGTSNDFATHIKMPTNFLEAVDRIISGAPQYIDVGQVNDDYFINVLSAGVFSSTSYKTSPQLKEMFGQVSYFLTATSQAFSYKPFEVKITTQDCIIKERLAVFLVFNGSSVGRINKFSDNSSIQDGVLDLIMLRDCNVQDCIRLVGELQDGTHMDDEHVVYLKEPNYKIELINGKCDKPDVDGDIGPEFPLNVKCVSNKLKIIM